MDKEFNVEEFVEKLLNEGNSTCCDETNEDFRKNERVPEFYNESLFKRGQQFYYNNVYTLFVGKFFGLMAILLEPTILRILVHTKQSSTDYTAYRRYVATVFHMCTWYDDDFYPNSKSWHSLLEVKRRHNLASKSSFHSGGLKINQKAMALTQFGFMGFAVTRKELIGLKLNDNEELKGFIHFWRVIGYLLGIQNRFNICRDSVEETIQICNLLITKVFHPQMQKKDPKFEEMSSYLVNGMWSMEPFLIPNVMLNYLNLLLQDSSNNNKLPLYVEMTNREKSMYNFISYIFQTAIIKYDILRIIFNSLRRLSFWLMKYCPFLAFHRFGLRNSYVRIQITNKTLK